MSLPHALLTSLLETPGSGLELAKRFDHSIGYFWQATHQQIYRELAKLEVAGWVESVLAEGGRGGKKIYRVLPAGEAELRRWAGEYQEPKPLRNELLLRLRADAIVGPTPVAADIERQLETHRQRLADYRRFEQRDFATANPTRQQRLQHLVLQAGIMMEEYWIRWSEQALAVLDETDGD